MSNNLLFCWFAMFAQCHLYAQLNHFKMYNLHFFLFFFKCVLMLSFITATLLEKGWSGGMFTAMLHHLFFKAADSFCRFESQNIAPSQFGISLFVFFWFHNAQTILFTLVLRNQAVVVHIAVRAEIKRVIPEKQVIVWAAYAASISVSIILNVVEYTMCW